jgi:hypothetical protein
MTGALAAAVLALLPGTALAHGEHEQGWVDCTDSSSAGVGGESGVDEPVSSDGEPVSRDDTPLCHAVPSFGGGYGSGGEAGGGGVAAESGGGDGDGGVRVAGCGGGAAGVTGDVGAGTAPSPLRPDSSTADVDTATAVPGVGMPVFAPSAAGWGRTGLRAAAVAGPCARAKAAIGGTGDGFVAPTRIDAGAGATAATSSSAPAVVGAAAMMLGAGLAGIRRGTRK